MWNTLRSGRFFCLFLKEEVVRFFRSVVVVGCQKFKTEKRKGSVGGGAASEFRGATTRWRRRWRAGNCDSGGRQRRRRRSERDLCTGGRGGVSKVARAR